MKEVILCYQGEMALKGLNKATFEAALAEGGLHHPEEPLFVLHALERDGPGDHADHRGGHLGGGDEALWPHVEEELGDGVVLAVHREGAVVRRARCGADAQGHLPLDHHRDAGEAFGLDEGGDDGGGDVIGQVGAGHGREAGELLIHQGGNVQLQDVGGEDLYVGAVPQGLVQHRQEGTVQLHRHHLTGRGGQLRSERADAGADLQHAVFRPNAGPFHQSPRYPVLDEKILPHGLGEVKAVSAQQGLDGIEIAEIHNSTPMC